MTKKVDCRGLFCPEPLFQLQTNLPGNSSVILQVDSEEVRDDVVDWVSKRDHGVKVEKIKDGEWELEVFS